MRAKRASRSSLPVRPRSSKGGLQVVVESWRRPGGGFHRRGLREPGANIVSRAETSHADILLQVRAIPPANGLHAGQTSSGSPIRLARRSADPRCRRFRRGDAVDGIDAAHHARAEHGRAVVDGDDRRIQGRAARGEPAAAHVPDADDRRGHRRLRRASSSSAPASPGCRRSRLRVGWARRSKRTTCARRSKNRCRALARRFVELPLESADAEDKGGYAKAQDESFYRRQREMMIKVVAGSDVVITTALIPGKTRADPRSPPKWWKRCSQAQSSSILQPSAAATAS